MLSLNQIDARISDLYEEIRVLRALRNAQTGLCRLPQELLHDILRYSTDFWSTESWKNLIRMACICRHLRTSLLAMHTLWASVPRALGRLETQEVFKTYLCRAGNAPLSLDVTFGESHSVFVVEAIKHYLGQFQLLHIILDYTVEAELSTSLVDHLYAHEAPLLQELVLSQSDGLRDPLDVPVRRRPISSTILGGACHYLTILQLGYIILEGIPAAPRLTTLGLWYTEASVRNLHAVLICLPNLQHLSLIPDFSLQEPEDDTFVALPIPMSNLRSLSIESNTKAIVRLLAFLPDPSERFTISRLGASRQDGLSPWSEQLPTNQFILGRLSKWLQMITGEAELPPACIWSEYAHRDRRIESLEDLANAGEPEIPVYNHCFILEESYKGVSPDASEIYICFSSTIDTVQDPDPFLLRVRELSITLDNCHDSIDARNDLDLYSLAALTRLSINNTRVAFHSGWRFAPALRGIVDWLITRREEGTPLNRVDFFNCDESTMRPMFAYLVDEQLAKEIVWT